MQKIRAIHIVYANWCPHCVPTTLEPIKNLALKYNIPLYLYDIDKEVQKADKIVKDYGDYSEDYIIPQVFIKFDEGIKHIFTGYSEGVNFTKRAIETFLNYDFNSMKFEFSNDFDLKEIIKEKLVGEGSCYSHCRDKTYYKFINEEPLIGIYYCNKGYISRVVSYWKGKANYDHFISFLNTLTKGKVNIISEDVRVATRYSWDLGIKDKNIMVREIYWTQNYNKLLQRNSEALYICKECNNLFTQRIPTENELCEKCLAK